VKRIVEVCERSALKWETFFTAEKLLQ